MIPLPIAIAALPPGTVPLATAPLGAVPVVASRPRSDQSLKLVGRVLLAEDGIDNQRIISLFLRKAGADVVVAGDGRAAVEHVNSQPMNLILMDIEMPELDGYAATRQLRAGGCTLPIIALTAHCDIDDRAKCLAAGCTDYLTKPIDKNTLLTSVARYLSGGPPAGATLTLPPVDSAPALSSPGQTLTSSFADDPGMQAAIADFVDLLPYRVAIMQRQLAERHLSELRRVVHQIKGAGGGYGFDPISQSAAQADQTLKQTSQPEAIERAVELLIGLIRSVAGYQPSRERFHV